MHFDSDSRFLYILSSDNKFEVIKVTLDKKDSLIKKLLRTEKRKALKRKRQEDKNNDEDEDTVKNISIDKEAIISNFEKG